MQQTKVTHEFQEQTLTRKQHNSIAFIAVPSVHLLPLSLPLIATPPYTLPLRKHPQNTISLPIFHALTLTRTHAYRLPAGANSADGSGSLESAAGVGAASSASK